MELETVKGEQSKVKRPCFKGCTRKQRYWGSHHEPLIDIKDTEKSTIHLHSTTDELYLFY